VVVALHDTGAQEHRFELRPNNSLTVKGAIAFYAAISTLTLCIAGGFAYAGLWVVLPFAGTLKTALAW